MYIQINVYILTYLQFIFIIDVNDDYGDIPNV